jgi:UDP-N-acetyl-D-galactosamine dehydrogenase
MISTTFNPSNALVVAVGHEQYRTMNAKELRALCRGDAPVLADVKALFNRHELANEGFTVFRL